MTLDFCFGFRGPYGERRAAPGVELMEEIKLVYALRHDKQEVCPRDWGRLALPCTESFYRVAGHLSRVRVALWTCVLVQELRSSTRKVQQGARKASRLSWEAADPDGAPWGQASLLKRSVADLLGYNLHSNSGAE